MTFLEALFYGDLANLIVWLCVAIFLLIRLRVSPASLDHAPVRRSTVSLPVVGGIIVAYLIVQTAVAVVALVMGAISTSDLMGPPTQPASQSQPASAASQAAGPETQGASQPQEVAPKGKSADHTVAINAIGTVTYLFTIIPVVIILPLFFRDKYRGWGLHIRQLPRGAIAGLVAFLIIFPILSIFGIGLEWIYEVFQHPMSEHSTFEALDQTPSLAQQLLLYGVAVVVAPLAEEIFFRGVLQTTLIQYGWGLVIPQFMRPGIVPAEYQPTALHRWSAITLTSVAFASLHPIDQAPLIFVLSLALGYVYERTGILWASIALHVAFNTTQMIIYTSS